MSIPKPRCTSCARRTSPTTGSQLFLKSYETGQTLQRVGPLSLFLEPRVHAWLRAMNAQRFNVYVSVNAVREGQRTRTKDAIAAVRHIFLEADEDGAKRLADDRGPRRSAAAVVCPGILAGRLHFFWRVAGFSTEGAERLQKHLARELGTDPAATSCSQTTRLAGISESQADAVAPRHVRVLADPEPATLPQSFPAASGIDPTVRPPAPRFAARTTSMNVVERARRYLARIEPAIAGQHGDLHTFKVCCRIVRGFALSDEEALAVLTDWNARCAPPWTERAELVDAGLGGRSGPKTHVVQRRQRILAEGVDRFGQVAERLLEAAERRLLGHVACAATTSLGARALSMASRSSSVIWSSR